MPLTSAVGRAQTRSRVLNPFSPYGDSLRALASQADSSNGSLAISARSSSVSSAMPS